METPTADAAVKHALAREPINGMAAQHWSWVPQPGFYALLTT